MQIHVHHQGAQIGPFTREAVAEMVRLGTLGPDANVWHEGLPDWIPAGQFLQQLPPESAATSTSRPAPAPDSEEPSEMNVVLKALACGFIVALIAGIVFGVIEARLGDATRGARRVLG